MNKESWTKEVLASLDDVKEVVPKDILFEQICNKIEQKQRATIPLSWVVGIAASFLLLVALNLSFITQKKPSLVNNDSEVLFNQFDDNNLNQLYR